MAKIEQTYTPGNILSGEPEFLCKYNCKVRYFPDNTIKVACFSRPVYNPEHFEQRKKSSRFEKAEGEWEWWQNPFTEKWERVYTALDWEFAEMLWEQERKERRKNAEKKLRNDNLKRAIDRAFEIGFSNDFQYFVTLTLDKEKIDRYDPAKIYPKLRNWLSHGVSRWGMDYIIFPEYHKQREGEEKRAVHFHGLVNGNLALTDSGKKTEEGRTIYNLAGWKYGFSTAIELDGKAGVIFYVTKYISKENERIFGRSYFSGGRTLKREVPAEYLNMDYESFDGEEYHIKVANMSVKYKTFSLGE